MTVRNQQDEWSPCPPGELQQMAQSLRTRSSRRATLRAMGTAAAAVSVILVSVIGVQKLWHDGGSGDMYFGGISCTEVRRLAPEFMAGNVSEEDAQRIRTHLGGCSLCLAFLERMRSQNVRPAAPTPVAIVFTAQADDSEDRISQESIDALLASLR